MNDIVAISIPNPFFEGRNEIYLLTSSPVTLIDTGIATSKAFEALQEAIEEHGLAVTDIERVVLTHKHIDHIGNAWRVQQASDAEVFIFSSEQSSLENVDPDGDRYRELVQQRLTGWHVPEDVYPDSAESARWRWEIESCPATPLEDKQLLPQGDGQLEVIHTPGHTMGSICLRYGDVLFSGDHVLPKISPNIGGGDMRRRGMLGHYLDSLDRVAQLDDELRCIYPGHGDSFEDLRGRCEQLARHHQRRLDKLVSVVAAEAGQTVYQLARRLFGRLKDFHVVLGCAEANAHLEHLVEQGAMSERDGRFYGDPEAGSTNEGDC